MSQLMKPRRCNHCGEQYAPQVHWQRYCSERCKNCAAQRRYAKRIKEQAQAAK